MERKAKSVDKKPQRYNLRKKCTKSNPIIGPASRTRSRVARSRISKAEELSSDKKTWPTTSVPALKTRRRNLPSLPVQKRRKIIHVLCNSLQLGENMEMAKKNYMAIQRSNCENAGNILHKSNSGPTMRTLNRASSSKGLPNTLIPKTSAFAAPVIKQRRASWYPLTPMHLDGNLEVLMRNFTTIADIELSDSDSAMDDLIPSSSCGIQQQHTAPVAKIGEDTTTEDIHSNVSCYNQLEDWSFDHQQKEPESAADNKLADRNVIQHNFNNANQQEHLGIAPNMANENLNVGKELDVGKNLNKGHDLNICKEFDRGSEQHPGNTVPAGNDIIEDCLYQVVSTHTTIASANKATQTEYPLPPLSEPYVHKLNYSFCALEYGMSCPCVGRNISVPEYQDVKPLYVMDATVIHPPPICKAEILLFVDNCIQSVRSQAESQKTRSALHKLYRRYYSILHNTMRSLTE